MGLNNLEADVIQRDRRLLSYADAATYCRLLSEGATRMAVSRGVIPRKAVVMLGRRTLLDKEVLDQFITEKREGRNEQPAHLKKDGSGGISMINQVVKAVVEEVRDLR